MESDLNGIGIPYFDHDCVYAADDEDAAALGGSDEFAPQIDNRCTSGAVTVYFKNLAAALTEHIAQAEVVVGCVAWLTHFPILQALSRVRGVSIVVQKEDFLRPDFGIVEQVTWAQRLRQAYDALPRIHIRNIWHSFSTGLYLQGDTEIDAVRCMGVRAAQPSPAQPRMHHKFLVFCRHGNRGAGYEPYAAWSGSFNMTKNAGMSLENATYFADEAIARAYLAEWMQVLALSEPLDWSSRWVQPHYDIRNLQTWSQT